MPRTKLLTAILAACLVLALVYLINDIISLNRKEADLNAQISASSGTLELMEAPPGDTQARLLEAEKSYQTALDGVTTEAVPTEVIRMLLDLAEKSGFRVNPITTEQGSLRNIGQSVYRIMPINFSLDGQLNQIVKFIRTLEDEETYPYLEIENAQITPLNSESSDSRDYDSTLQIRISIIERITNSK